MKRKSFPSGENGFSLVEIALALGIAIFALVAVVGIMRLAIDADSDAGKDTALATMAGQVLSDLRSSPFDALWAAVPSNVGITAKPSADLPVDSVFYFTSEGAPLLDASAANSFAAAYKCVVKKTRDEDTKSISTGIYNKLFVRLDFSWPANTGNHTPARTNTQSINATIARY